MLSAHSFNQDVNHSQSHYGDKLNSHNQLGIPPSSRIDVEGRGSTYNDVDVLNVKSQNANAKKRFTKKQLILIGVAIVVVIGAIVGGVVAYKVLSGKDDDNNSEDEKDEKTFGKFEKEIKAGQENNLITIIHIPNSEKQYTYKVTTTQKVQDKDKTSQEDIDLTSSYKFGVICLNVNEQEFDMVLYFIESSIPKSQDDKLKFQDYPIPSDQSNQNQYNDMKNIAENDDDSLDISQNKNEMSFLSKQEIELIQKQNISAQDFLNSNKPIIRFKVNKIGKITEIEKPLNLRYDINTILMNVLEQISPIVSKNYYNVNGKNRILQSYQRVLQNNVPVNMKANVEDSLKGKLEKSYEDNQKTAHSNQKTAYSQSSEFKDGALKTSKIESNVQLISLDAETQNESTKQIFNSLQVNSKGSIEFDQKIDTVDPEFLKKMMEIQSKMFKLKLTWEQATDLFNKIRSSDNNSAASQAQRLLQSDDKIGKEIRTSIFKSSFASIDFGADLVQSCNDAAFDYYVKCTTSIVGNFHSISKPIFEKSVFKPYIASDKDIVRNMTYYIKNSLVNLMASTQQKVNQQFNIAHSVLDNIISRHESFKGNKMAQIVSDIKNQTSIEQKNLKSKITSFDDQLVEFLKYQKDVSKNWTDTYNQAFQKEYTKYKQMIDDQTSAIITFLDKSYDGLSGLINKILNANKAISINTYNNLKYMIEYYPKAISDTLDEKLYDDFKSVGQNARNMCNSLKSVFDPYVAQLVESVKAKWLSFDQEYNANFDKISGFSNYEAQNIGDYISSGVFYQYGCEVIQNLSNNIEGTVRRYVSIGRHKSQTFLQVSDLYSKITKDKVNNNISSDDFTDESTNLKKYFETSSSIKKDFKQATKDIIASTSNFLDDGKVIAIQVQDKVQAHQQRLSKFYFNYSDNVKQSYLNLKQNLETSKDQIQAEYTEYVNILSQGSERIIKDIDSIYKEVFAFIENKNYPSENPFNTQKPPDENYFNREVFGINEVSLSKRIDEFESKLNQIYQFSEATENLNKLISKSLSEMIDFLNDNMIAPVDIVNYYFFSGYEQTFKKYMPLVFTKQNQIIKEYLTSEFSKPNQLVIKSMIYPKVGSFVKKDVAQSLAKAILRQQEYMVSKYIDIKKYIITYFKPTGEKNFGDLSSLSSPSSPFEIKSQYFYIFPTPIGVNIKLNLQVQWTISMSNSLLSENNNFNYTSIADVKSVVTGTFSSLISTTEIGGLASGTFVDSSVVSKTNYNTKESAGDNSVEAKFAPTNINIVQYIMLLVPKIMTDCSQQEVVFKPQTNGIKSSISSAVQAGVNLITGSKPDNKCQSVVTASATKKDLFKPIKLQDKPFSKQLVGESYSNKQ